jgi:hypothetical protein
MGSALTGPRHQEDGWTALKTADGLLFVWNRPGLGFTLSIKGNEIKPTEGGENIFFLVDDVVLQIQSLPISNFAPEAGKAKLNDEAVLMAHRDWEAKFIENELLRRKISVQSASEKIANGMAALVWQYELPEGFKGPDAQKQMYVTVVAKGYVILLNGVVSSTASEATVRQFLLDTVATLKVSSERIDVKKEQEKIRKGP